VPNILKCLGEAWNILEVLVPDQISKRPPVPEFPVLFVLFVEELLEVFLLEVEQHPDEFTFKDSGLEEEKLESKG
jgi:hypothetical protein